MLRTLESPRLHPTVRRLPRRQALFPVGSLYPAAKRAFDLLATGLGVLLVAPVFLLISACIYLEDRGPVLFAQRRVGKGGREFTFWKFRSMCVDAEERLAALAGQSEDPHRFKLERDPRITRVGAFLRRTSLDELPQLFNVLLGDMSLVGPRPALPEEVADYDEKAARRLEVEQGITCLWQVSGRSLLSFEEQIDLDLEYIEKRGLLFDVWLLLRTVPAVLLGTGAY